jgi:hypothetical protein
MNPATSRVAFGCLLIMALVLVACSSTMKDSPKESAGHNAALEKTINKSIARNAAAKETSDEFVFEFRYGTNAKNVLDTFNGTFTRDMVVGKPIVVKLRLSKKQLKEIQNKMLEIGLFEYPSTFSSKPSTAIIGEQTPFDTFYFKVKSGNLTKELSWENKYLNENRKVVNLRELTGLIVGIIQESPEYKKIPEPRGGYE